MGKKTKASTGPRFLQFYHWEMECPAYRLLSCYGRALLMEFRRLYNGHNNGEIYMSVRQAGKLLNCHKDTAAKYIVELDEKGWIRQTSKGHFSQKTDKTASTWRITNQPIGLGVDTPETKEYMKWKPEGEIQNTVLKTRTTCPKNQDRTPLNCPKNQDRDTPKTPLYGPKNQDTYISNHRGDAEGPLGQPVSVATPT